MIQHNPPLPNTYWIDIVSVCNLKCPMCPQAYGTMGRNSFMSLECFKRLVDDVSKTKPLIKLYMSGESMLHPNLFEMIEYVNEVGCTSMLHTNGTLLNKDKSVKLINSSLNYLSFSFDGSNSEVYEKMRTPAKFHDVKSKILEYFKLKYPNLIMDINLEEFTNNSEVISKKIYEFCSLNWSKETLNFYKREDLHTKTLSFAQVRKKISSY